MSKKILFILSIIFISIISYSNENLLNKTIQVNEVKKIWPKIEIIKTTKKEVLKILENYKLDSINLLNNKKTGQLAFSFEYKDNRNNINRIAFLFPGTFISDSINFGDIVIDIYPKLISNQKNNLFPIYENKDWKVLKENIDLDNIIYQFAVSSIKKETENNNNFVKDKDNNKSNLEYINFIQEEKIKLIMHKFLDHIYNSNSYENKTLLIYSIIYKYPDLLLNLIKNGANINFTLFDKKSPLIYALEYNSPQTAKILIEKGCNINIIDKDQWTPLLYALKNKYPEIALLLINNGAEININNKKEETPLILAIELKYPEIVKLLINKGAEINTRFKNVYTPLAYALRYSTPEIVKLLIDNNAKLSNSYINKKITPLIYALLNSRPEIAKMLIKNGADVNVINKAGQSPLDLAKSHGYNEIIELLKKYGAK